MTEAEIKSKLDPTLPGPRILKDQDYAVLRVCPFCGKLLGFKWGGFRMFFKRSHTYCPRCYAAAMRHLTQFWAGEDLDPGEGSKHVIAAAWHCFALAQFMDEHRYRPGNLGNGNSWKSRRGASL